MGSARIRMLLLFGVVGLGLSGASRGASVVFSLGAPTVTPFEATFAVELTFTGDPGDQIEAIQLGVLDSDPLLTAGGTDFSRFSIDLDTATLPGWLELAPINLAGVGLYAPDDPGPGPFLSPSATPYAIGTLRVDLTGLSAGTDLFVTLAADAPLPATDVGGLVGGSFVPSFAADGLIEFAEPNGVPFTAVPEPASLMLSGLGGMMLASRMRCQRSSFVGHALAGRSLCPTTGLPVGWRP